MNTTTSDIAVPDVLLDAPAQPRTADGKTLHQEAVDSASALGIAMLASTVALLATLTVVALLILR